MIARIPDLEELINVTPFVLAAPSCLESKLVFAFQRSLNIHSWYPGSGVAESCVGIQDGCP